MCLATLASVSFARAAPLETIAGGKIGDGLPATEVAVTADGLVADDNGDLYFSDSGRVRRVDARSGLVGTVVDRHCTGGYGPPSACVAYPQGLAMDLEGNLLVADEYARMVLRWSPTTGELTTLAGRGGYADPYPTDDVVPASEASIGPTDVAVDPAGHVFIASGERVFRFVPGTGLVEPYAGALGPGSPDVEDGPAVAAHIGRVHAIAVDRDGALLVASGDAGDHGDRIWRIDAARGTIARLAGRRDLARCDWPPSRRRARGLCIAARDVDVDAAGRVLFSGADAVLRFDPSKGRVHRIPAPPGRIHVDRVGNVYSTIPYGIARTEARSGRIVTVAGNGTSGFCGDGLLATEACTASVGQVAFDPAGNLLLLDEGRLRRVDAATGRIATIAGGGRHCTRSDDPVPACDACLSAASLAVAPNGDVAVVQQYEFDDVYTSRIRRLDAATGIVTTVAGRCLRRGREDVEGVPAVEACLYPNSIFPISIAFDPQGEIHATARGRVWRIDRTSGRLVAVAGSGREDCRDVDDGDGGPAARACLEPVVIAFDGAGNLFVGESNRIRRVDRASGLITTVVGRRTCDDGVLLDGGAATAGCLWQHDYGFAVGRGGDVFVAGYHAGNVRRVDATSGIIQTIAGPADPSCCSIGCTSPEPPVCLRTGAITVDPRGRPVLFDQTPPGRVVRVALPAGDTAVKTPHATSELAPCAPPPLERGCVDDGDCPASGPCMRSVCSLGTCRLEPRRSVVCAARDLAAAARCVGSANPMLDRRIRRMRRVLRRPGNARLGTADGIRRRLDDAVRADIVAGRLGTDCGGAIVERLETLRRLIDRLER